MEESPYVQVMRVNDLIGQRDRLLTVCQMVLTWVDTDINTHEGSFRYFMDNIEPVLREAAREVEES